MREVGNIIFINEWNNWLLVAEFWGFNLYTQAVEENTLFLFRSLILDFILVLCYNNFATTNGIHLHTILKARRIHVFS